MDEVLLGIASVIELGFIPGLDLFEVPFWQGSGVPPELKAALEGLSEAIAAAPHDADLRFRRAAVCQGLGRDAEAYADLRETIRLAPEHARAWLLLSEVLHRLKHYDHARSARQRALEIDAAVAG